MQGGTDRLAAKLNSFVQLTEKELECLTRLQSRPSSVKAGHALVQEGQTGHKAFILQAGWACSFKIMRDGSRQIIGFPIPGDCIGLRSVLLRTSDHSFSALTEATVSGVDASRMMAIFTEFPRLAAAILWAASREEAMVVEHLVNIGRRNALERTANFFLELGERLRLVGMASDTAYACPLNQYVLADALGLSAIHVNRVLRQLRERGLMTLKGGQVVIHDVAGLERLGGFEQQDQDHILRG
jgi:CRP-like cAMP-binding protein